MTRQQAQQILLLYRPGTADWEDPEVAQAIKLAGEDPELGRWFQQQQAFQAAVRTRFRDIVVPEHSQLAARMSEAAGSHDVRPESEAGPVSLPVRQAPWAGKRPTAPWWRPAIWLASALALVLIVGFVASWLKPVRPDRFTHYERMMVSTAIRGYNMEYATPDLGQLRGYFAGKGAPADFSVAPGLSKLTLLGGTALTWRNHPVAMVCFDRPDKKKVWLFVMPSAALKDAPPSLPHESRISSLMTASWTAGGQTYVLAGPPERGFREKYL